MGSRSLVSCLLLLLTSSNYALAEEEGCYLGNFGCYSEGGNLVDSIELPDFDSCRNACVQNEDCKYFTYYNASDNTELSKACLLLSSCPRYNERCTDCVTGSRACGSCSLPLTRGGHHYCDRNMAETEVGHKVSELATCHYTCGQQLITRQCLNGLWEGPEASCPCRSAPPADQVTCTEATTWQGNMAGRYGDVAGRYGNLTSRYDKTGWPGGLICSEACTAGQKEAATFVCRDGDWVSEQVACSSQDTEDSSLILIIVLSVVGGLALILLLAGGIWLAFSRRRRRRGDRRDRTNPPIKGFGSEASVATVRENNRHRFEAYEKGETNPEFFRISTWSDHRGSSAAVLSDDGDLRSGRHGDRPARSGGEPYRYGDHHMPSRYGDHHMPSRFDDQMPPGRYGEVRSYGREAATTNNGGGDGNRRSERRSGAYSPPPPTYQQDHLRYSELLRQDERIGRPIKTWY